jgi:hypothetical protein
VKKTTGFTVPPAARYVLFVGLVATVMAIISTRITGLPKDGAAGYKPSGNKVPGFLPPTSLALAFMLRYQARSTPLARPDVADLRPIYVLCRSW